MLDFLAAAPLDLLLHPPAHRYSLNITTSTDYAHCSGRSNVTHQTTEWTHVCIMLIRISVVLISAMIYSFYQIPHLWERPSVSFKDSRGITCRRTLRQWNGNFPPAISTAFIPACASYFLSSSARFLLCHSYFSFIAIVPFLLKRDTVCCRDNIQPVSSHPRISSQE